MHSTEMSSIIYTDIKYMSENIQDVTVLLNNIPSTSPEFEGHVQLIATTILVNEDSRIPLWEGAKQRMAQAVARLREIPGALQTEPGLALQSMVATKVFRALDYWLQFGQKEEQETRNSAFQNYGYIRAVLGTYPGMMIDDESAETIMKDTFDPEPNQQLDQSSPREGTIFSWLHRG